MKYTFLLLAFFAAQSYAMCEKERNTGSDTDIIECYKKEVKKSNKKLNDVYSEYEKNLDAEEKNKLIELQKTWTRYKSKQCEFEVNGYGSLGGQIYNQCVIEINRKRILEINYMSECGMEGNNKFCLDFRPM